jgi:site-specific recombinase XerD
MYIKKNDIHNYSKRFQYSLGSIERATFSEEDKEHIIRFADHLKARDLNLGRIVKYIYHLIVIRRALSCNFKKADRSKIEKLMIWLNSQPYKPGTKADMKGSLKRFYRWLHFGNSDKDQPYPQEVSWIKEKIKKEWNLHELRVMIFDL